jgi:hypothetical protein
MFDMSLASSEGPIMAFTACWVPVNAAILTVPAAVGQLFWLKKSDPNHRA